MYSNKKTKRWRLLAPEYVFDTGRIPFNTLENSNILSWPPRRAPSPALRAAVLQNMLVHCPHMDVLDLQSSPSHLYHLRCEILLLPPSVVLAGACGHGFGLHSSHAIGPMDRTYRLPRLLLLHQNVRAPLGIRHPLQLRLFEFGRAGRNTIWGPAATAGLPTDLPTASNRTSATTAWSLTRYRPS